LCVCGGLMALRSTRRRMAIAYAVFFLLVAFGWGGTSQLAARFAEANNSVRNRLAIWQDAVRVAQAFPMAGTGLNTYGTAMLFFQRADPANHYTRAHNDYLQLAAEGGVLVGIPALLLVVTVASGMLD